MSTGATVSIQDEPRYFLTRSSVDLFFWSGVLILLGYLVYLPSASGLHVAFHGRLGRIALMVGGGMMYGCLKKSKLRPVALVLMILCVVQALFMAGGVAVSTFNLLSPRLQEREIVDRARSLALGLDFAMLAVLVVLLRGAGHSSRSGYRVGLVFCASTSLVCLLAPFVLGEGFWHRLREVFEDTSAQSSLLMSVKVVLLVAALFALVKTRRLVRGHEAPTAAGGVPSGEGGEGEEEHAGED